MRELFEGYKQFDSFIKMQLLVISVVSLGWALIMPIITKLQGTLWATSIIAGYLILHRLSVFIMPLFKNLKLKEGYKAIIILDVLYLAFIPIYFVSPLAFLYTEGFLMVIYGVIMTVFCINYDAYIMEEYDSAIFKDVQYIERMVVATAGLLGSAIVILVDVLSSDIDTSLYVFMVILTTSLIFQLYNYRYHWNTL